MIILCIIYDCKIAKHALKNQYTPTPHGVNKTINDIAPANTYWNSIRFLKPFITFCVNFVVDLLRFFAQIRGNQLDKN